MAPALDPANFKTAILYVIVRRADSDNFANFVKNHAMTVSFENQPNDLNPKTPKNTFRIKFPNASHAAFFIADLYKRHGHFNATLGSLNIVGAPVKN